MAYKISSRTWSQLHHFASFPQTGISLRQMVQFGRNLNPGTVLQAGSFLAEELPIRLAHRVKELDELPNGLNEMPSIVKVKDWYAQSFEELVSFPKPELPKDLREQLSANIVHNALGLQENSRNLAVDEIREGIVEGYSSVNLGGERMTPMKTQGDVAGPSTKGQNGNKDATKRRIPLQHRYYSDHTNIKNWPPEVIDYNERFTRALEKIKRRHDPVVTTVAQGVLEYKRARKGENIQADIQRFLDRFYMSRIGIRILIGQQIALARTAPTSANAIEGAANGGASAANVSPPSPFGSANDSSYGHRASEGPRAGGVNVPRAGAGPSGKEDEEYVGIICTNTNVGAIATEAIENARYIAEEHFGLFRAPPVELICPKDLTFMYIPSHLNHMLFELLKNSLRAVIERSPNEDNFPPIKVIIVEGKEDITIKISDQGGGIPRSEMPLVWTYMYTTASSEDLDPDFQGSDFKAPMAGYGYGLPLSRLYARYFGGDIKVISLDGYGTDCYVHLSRLSSSEEPLP